MRKLRGSTPVTGRGEGKSHRLNGSRDSMCFALSLRPGPCAVSAASIFLRLATHHGLGKSGRAAPFVRWCRRRSQGCPRKAAAALAPAEAPWESERKRERHQATGSERMRLPVCSPRATSPHVQAPDRRLWLQRRHLQAHLCRSLETATRSHVHSTAPTAKRFLSKRSHRRFFWAVGFWDCFDVAMSNRLLHEQPLY